MDRKELVRILSDRLGVKEKYLGAPSFAYEVGGFTVTRDGEIINKAGEEMTLNEITTPTSVDEFDFIEIAFPIEGHDVRTIRNLLNMLYSKQPLFKKVYALEENIVEEEFIDEISNLESLDELLAFANKDNCKGVSFEDSKITFNFIKGDIAISSDFLSLLIKKAKELTYASSKQIETDNDKYSFRTWLIRLGMIGTEFKEHRKTLLANLTGSSAFRNGPPADKEAQI